MPCPRRPSGVRGHPGLCFAPRVKRDLRVVQVRARKRPRRRDRAIRGREEARRHMEADGVADVKDQAAPLKPDHERLEDVLHQKDQLAPVEVPMVEDVPVKAPARRLLLSKQEPELLLLAVADQRGQRVADDVTVLPEEAARAQAGVPLVAEVHGRVAADHAVDVGPVLVEGHGKILARDDEDQGLGNGLWARHRLQDGVQLFFCQFGRRHLSRSWGGCLRNGGVFGHRCSVRGFRLRLRRVVPAVHKVVRDPHHDARRADQPPADHARPALPWPALATPLAPASLLHRSAVLPRHLREFGTDVTLEPRPSGRRSLS